MWPLMMLLLLLLVLLELLMLLLLLHVRRRLHLLVYVGLLRNRRFGLIRVRITISHGKLVLLLLLIIESSGGRRPTWRSLHLHLCTW